MFAAGSFAILDQPLLKKRHNFFATAGCSVSDHGLENIYAEDYTESEIKNIFSKIRSGKNLEPNEKIKIKSALLYEFAQWDHEKNWVQQFHRGAAAAADREDL